MTSVISYSLHERFEQCLRRSLPRLYAKGLQVGRLESDRCKTRRSAPGAMEVLGRCPQLGRPRCERCREGQNGVRRQMRRSEALEPRVSVGAEDRVAAPRGRA